MDTVEQPRHVHTGARQSFFQFWASISTPRTCLHPRQIDGKCVYAIYTVNYSLPDKGVFVCTADETRPKKCLHQTKSVHTRFFVRARPKFGVRAVFEGVFHVFLSLTWKREGVGTQGV